MKKIKCFLGFHNWTWTLRKINELETEPVTGKIPLRAVCSRCLITYIDTL